MLLLRAAALVFCRISRDASMHTGERRSALERLEARAGFR